MTAAKHRFLFAERALLADGWASGVRIGIDAAGAIASLDRNAGPRGAERLAGPVLPTLVNLHSHSFQRAMAGLAGIAGAGDDSFWTWRDLMYRLVGMLEPEDVGAVAAKLQVELLKGGFGRLVEFHYLHHDRDGSRYADPAEMSLRLLDASRRTGLPLTLLPVFYAHSDFGGAPPHDGQRRFVNGTDDFLGLMDRLARPAAEAGARLGLALHSLRAATQEEISALVAAAPAGAPVHIHVAEQVREVEACLAHSGLRPVEYLYDRQPVDPRWCLVHATHVTADEIGMIARSGAVAGLCPATEADLGDGVFPAVDFLAAGGRFGIGTDSHVSVSVADELRILEYGQRLVSRRRNRLVDGPGASVGRTLFGRALAGGAQAGGSASAGLAIGAPADLLVLDGASPYIAASLSAATGDSLLDRWIFGGIGPVVRDVMIGGVWRIEEGRHKLDEAIDADFAGVLKRLAA